MKTSELLGISRKTLWEKMKKLKVGDEPSTDHGSRWQLWGRTAKGSHQGKCYSEVHVDGGALAAVRRTRGAAHPAARAFRGFDAEGTLKNYLSHIMDKLHVPCQVELAWP